MGTNVLIAWNCSTEQARATAFAMPILKRASRVVVLTRSKAEQRYRDQQVSNCAVICS
jgi:hypothetical protein